MHNLLKKLFLDPEEIQIPDLRSEVKTKKYLTIPE
jgi:hypothetical protein